MSTQNSVNIFEKASRLELRFKTPKGLLSAESLWSLPLTSTRGHANLDDIARAISQEIKNSELESFVTDSTQANKLEVLRLDIVKRIIEVKIEERDAEKLSREQAARRIALKEALEKKRLSSLENMTEAELEAEMKKIS